MITKGLLENMMVVLVVRGYTQYISIEIMN